MTQKLPQFGALGGGPARGPCVRLSRVPKDAHGPAFASVQPVCAIVASNWINPRIGAEIPRQARSRFSGLNQRSKTLANSITVQPRRLQPASA